MLNICVPITRKVKDEKLHLNERQISVNIFLYSEDREVEFSYGHTMTIFHIKNRRLHCLILDQYKYLSNFIPY